MKFGTRNLKLTILTLYTLIVVCAGFATILEKFYGTPFVSQYIYGASWFVALWALLTVSALIYMLKVKLQKRPAVMMLHLSFVVILLGALTTHITAERGTVHLRLNKDVRTFQLEDSTDRQLSFAITLREFRIINYPGTEAAMDYQSVIALKPWNMELETMKPSETITVSMNHIGDYEGYRFFQSAYDSDCEGTVLGVSHDPYGIAITYTGYLLLLISIIWTLYTKRKLFTVKKGEHKLGIISLLLLFSINTNAEGSPQAVSPEIAHKMGTIVTLYNDRLCPLNTAATDFVTKLTGSNSWNGYSADEIFFSWMIYYTDWEEQPIIKVKDSEVQRMIGIDGQWASVRDFYTPQQEYKLEARLHDNSYSDATKRAIRETDEKVRTITMFYNSEMLHIFPLTVNSRLGWYTPGSTELPKNIPNAEFQFIKHSMDYLVKNILVNDSHNASVIIAKIKLYQKEKAGSVIPSPLAVKAEIFYNYLLYARWIVYLILTLSLLQCILYMFGIRIVQTRRFRISSITLMVLFALYLTLLLALRWWLSGHLPMSNGYETMLFMSWITMVFTLSLGHKVEVLKVFGPFLAALCLLVAMIASGSPQITQLMPVLQSPLLSVHVMVIMAAYSLLALTFMKSAAFWLGRFVNMSKHQGTPLYTDDEQGESPLLFSAICLLTVGIFIGAVWANVSWGNYWSWDPKEVWALITLMIYAVPLHLGSFPAFRNPKVYHLYMVIAFLTVLMTYFGVNFFLSGMHSYA